MTTADRVQRIVAILPQLDDAALQTVLQLATLLVQRQPAESQRLQKATDALKRQLAREGQDIDASDDRAPGVA